MEVSELLERVSLDGVEEIASRLPSGLESTKAFEEKCLAYQALMRNLGFTHKEAYEIIKMYRGRG